MTGWTWTLTADPRTGRQHREITRGPQRRGGSVGTDRANGPVRLRTPELGSEESERSERYPDVCGPASVADRFGVDRAFDAGALGDLVDSVFNSLADGASSRARATSTEADSPGAKPTASPALGAQVTAFLQEAERSGSPRAAELRRRIVDRDDQPASRLRLDETIGLARIVPADQRADRADVLMPSRAATATGPHVARICAETWLYAHLFTRFHKVSAASLRALADRLVTVGLVDDRTRALAVLFLLDHPRRLAGATGTPVAEIDSAHLDLELSAATELLNRAATAPGDGPAWS